MEPQKIEKEIETFTLLQSQTVERNNARHPTNQTFKESLAQPDGSRLKDRAKERGWLLFLKGIEE